MPLARATGIGSTADCADHSKSVCRRQRSTISSPVMASAMVVIGPRCYPNRKGFTTGNKATGGTGEPGEPGNRGKGKGEGKDPLNSISPIPFFPCSPLPVPLFPFSLFPLPLYAFPLLSGKSETEGNPDRRRACLAGHHQYRRPARYQ